MVGGRREGEGRKWQEVEESVGRWKVGRRKGVAVGGREGEGREWREVKGREKAGSGRRWKRVVGVEGRKREGSDGRWKRVMGGGRE